MKRLIGTLALAAALGAVLAVPSAVAKDANGPPCTDVISGDAGYIYNRSNDSGTVTLDMNLAKPACPDATYLLDIFDLTTGARVANDVVPTAIAGNLVSFSYTFGPGQAPGEWTGDPSDSPTGGACVVAESYWRGHLADRAPDTGCVSLPADGSSGGGGGIN